MVTGTEYKQAFQNFYKNMFSASQKYPKYLLILGKIGNYYQMEPQVDNQSYTSEAH